MSGKTTTEVDLEVDLLIVGGGVHGAALARDAALRGIRVAIAERDDWGAGASGSAVVWLRGTTELVEGGALAPAPAEDFEVLRRTAPGLVVRVPCLVPVEGRTLRARWSAAALEARLALHLGQGAEAAGDAAGRVDAAWLEARVPTMVRPELGAVAFDEWAIDGARLSRALVRDALAHGALALAQHEVVGLLRTSSEPGAEVCGAVARSRAAGTLTTIRARRVVDATGAGSSSWLARVGVEARPTASGAGPTTRSVQVVLDRAPWAHSLLWRGRDGALHRLWPWQGHALLEGLELPFEGDPGAARASTHEVRALLNEASRWWPDAVSARVLGTRVAVRAPVGAAGGGVVDHGAAGALGLVSLVAGPPSMHRVLAARIGDGLARALGAFTASRTAHVPLLDVPPPEPSAEALAERARVSLPVVQGLMARHGVEAGSIAGRLARAGEERALVCVCESVTEAEVRHVIEVENVHDLAAIARRTGLGLGVCGGMRCAHRCAQILAGARGGPPSDAHAMAAAFLEARHRTRCMALDGAAVVQDELAVSLHLSLGLGERGHA